MIRRPISQRRRAVLGVVSMTLLVVLYTALSWWIHNDVEFLWISHKGNPTDTTIPTWTQFGRGIREAVCVSPEALQRWQDARVGDPGLERPQPWIVSDARATAGRLFFGLGLGVAGSLAIGLLMGCSRTVEAFVLPVIAFLAKIPPTAALSVFFVLLGTQLKMYVGMVVFGILPTITQSVYLAARDVSDEYFHKALTLGARDVDSVCRVMFPFVLPKVLDAVRLAFGPAVVYLMAAEMLSSDAGFGYRIRLQARLLDMKVVYPYLIMLATFTFSMDWGLRWLQKRACPWYIREGG